MLRNRFSLPIRNFRLSGLIALAFVSMANPPAQVHAVDIIDTTSAWTGGSVGDFGEVNDATYGQVVTTGSKFYKLQEFSFWITTSSSFGSSRFAAYVMAWDNTNFRASGPVLFESGLYTNPPGSGWVEFRVPVNVTLAPNTQYVLFFNASKYFDGNKDVSAFRSLDSDLYAGGNFVSLRNGSDFNALTSTRWGEPFRKDLAFRAVFVPEPSTYALGIIGSGVMAVLARRRKTQRV